MQQVFKHEGGVRGNAIWQEVLAETDIQIQHWSASYTERIVMEIKGYAEGTLVCSKHAVGIHVSACQLSAFPE